MSEPLASILRQISGLIESKSPVSMAFWGPVGVGKTTLARIFAGRMDAEF